MQTYATIDGQDVVIVQMTKRKYTAVIAYIDAQDTAGNLKIKEIPLTELPLTMATGSTAGWGVQRLSPTWWDFPSATYSDWDGTKWKSVAGGKGYYFVRFGITDANNWYLGYRPEKMRLLWTAGIGSMRVEFEDTDANYVYRELNQSCDGTYNEVTLDWGNNLDFEHGSSATVNFDSNDGYFEVLDIRFSS